MRNAAYYKEIADEARRIELERTDALAQKIIEENEEKIAALAEKGKYRAEFAIRPSNVGVIVAHIYTQNGYTASYDGKVVTVIWRD